MPPPVVTGLSPIEGPPGTRVTIRGENFGTKPSDLIGLTICGCDCLLSAEWKSSNKIIARSGPGKGKGDVIIKTRLGGIGTCNVSFKGYHEAIGPMKESAVWVEEAPLFVWGRHSMSPTSYQQDDPLGLSVEENDKKFPEDDLLELFPGYSGDISAENFSACWFLLENHYSTSFNDLQAGLLHLRRKVEGQKEGQLSFLKANVGSVMDQIDTIVMLKDKFKNDVDDYGIEPSIILEKCIKEAERDARKLFDNILSRRDRAEKTRNALNVLARFKFLFCLPCVMDRNIKKGDYDMVINDYMRVKNLFNKTEVSVFKVALMEIERCIDGLQKILYQKLIKLPISVDEQKLMIRHLVNLDAPNEPAWDAIQVRFDYINSRFKQCYSEHISMGIVVNDELSKGKNLAMKYFKYSTPQETLGSVPENILFIEELYELLNELFPDLWKLGQSYFSGELHVKIESGRQAAFKHMVLTVIETFCLTLRSALIPHTINADVDRSQYGIWTIPDWDAIAPWLPACLRYIRSSYKLLIKLDLPSEVLSILAKLIMDLRIYSIGILFKQTSDQVKHFHKFETWKIAFTDDNTGITNLPMKFQQSVQELTILIKESILSNEQREASLLDNPTVHKELDKQMETLLLIFHGVLRNLAFKDAHNGDRSDCSPIVSQLIGTPVNAYRIYDVTNHIPVWEYRLLATLSNCQYTTKFILPHIVESFQSVGYFLSQTSMENVKSSFIVLEKSILDAYLEQKCDPLVGTIEPSMYLGRFDWDTEYITSDIRPYAKECINNLINVHSEVYRISPSIVESVLTQIVQTIAEELYRLMSCVQKFSEAGKQQAHADIGVLQEVFRNYSTSKAITFFNDAREIIPLLSEMEAKQVGEIMKQCCTRMKLQTLSLSRQDGK